MKFKDTVPDDVHFAVNCHKCANLQANYVMLESSKAQFGYMARKDSSAGNADRVLTASISSVLVD